MNAEMLYYKHKAELYELNEFIRWAWIKILRRWIFYHTVNLYDEDIIIAIHESLPEARMRACWYKNGVGDTEKLFEKCDADCEICYPTKIKKTKSKKHLSTKKKK